MDGWMNGDASCRAPSIRGKGEGEGELIGYPDGR
jgi:hypothetical protein